MSRDSGDPPRGDPDDPDEGTPDATALRRLRRVARAMQDQDAQGVPMRELVALAREVDDRVTIDLDPADELGQPLVLVHAPRRPPPTSFAALTKREWEVARLIAQGLQNKQIAARLHISLSTVKDHVHNILDKTGLPGRAAVIAALR